MKVKATQLGYYGNKRRKEGDVFDIADEKAFSKRWMVKVSKGAKVSEPEPEVEDEVTGGDQGQDDEDVI